MAHRHGLDGLLDGRAPVDAVQVVQVHVIHLQLAWVQHLAGRRQNSADVMCAHMPRKHHESAGLGGATLATGVRNCTSNRSSDPSMALRTYAGSPFCCILPSTCSRLKRRWYRFDPVQRFCSTFGQAVADRSRSARLETYLMWSCQ